MDLGVVGTTTTLQAALNQDDKTVVWPSHAQVLTTVHAHKKDTLSKRIAFNLDKVYWALPS